MTPNVTDIITTFYEVLWSFIDYALPKAWEMTIIAGVFLLASLTLTSFMCTLVVIVTIVLHPNEKMKYIKLAFQEILENVVDEVVGKEAEE